MSWRLMLRHWWRELRSGELRVLMFALGVGVLAVATTGLLSDRLNRALTEQGGSFLGADLLLSSPEEVKPELLRMAPPLRTAALALVSMAAHGEAFQMTSVRAVEADYPLRGQVFIAAAPGAKAIVQSAQPPVGAVFVDAQLLSLLEVEVGDDIALGEREFRIAGIVTDEPGRAGAAMFGMAPRVFMRRDEVASTGMVQPGSQVGYLYYFAGSEADIQHFSAAVKPALSSSQSLRGGRDGSEALGKSYKEIERFFALASLSSLLMAAVAVVLATRRYCQRQRDTAALLRCHGYNGAQTLGHFYSQLLLCAALASGLGIALAFALQSALLGQLLPDLAQRLPAAGLAPVLAALATALLALTGAALPALLALARVPPMRVLRADVDAMPKSAWLSAGVSGLLFLGLCYWYAGEARLVLGFVCLLLALVAVLALLSQGILLFSRGLQRGLSTHGGSGPSRFGLAQLLRHRRMAMVQLGAFALALFLMLATALVRTDLIDSWRSKLASDAPNHFLVNIAPAEADAFKAYFAAQNLAMTTAYPMARGRLTHINNVLVADAVPAQARSDGALQRELNLTWASELPANNVIAAGTWFGTDGAQTSAIAGELSVEAELAERLGLKLGDSLRFRIAEQSVEAKLSSLRKVDWNSMQPNFFVIFAPGQLESYPHTFIAAAKIAPTQKAALAGVVKNFPTVVVIAVDKIFEDIERITGQMILAVESLLALLMLAGLCVLAAALLASIDERRREAVLLRALGAGKSFLRRALVTEFAIVGAGAGLLAVAGAELLSSFVMAGLMDVPTRLHPWLWLLALPLATLVVCGLGLWATRTIVQVSPLTALRELG